MAYHANIYLFLFLPVVLLVYQIIPKKKRWVVLLLAGYIFFWLVSKKRIIYLIGATVITYAVGLLLEWMNRICAEKIKEIPEERLQIQKQYQRRKKLLLLAGVLLLLSGLIYLKYYYFFAKNINLFFSAPDGRPLLRMKKFLLPIGISFYTLQAIGYLADVYWGKVSAQRNLGKLALFLSFFPQIMEGPISMYSQIADALFAGEGLKMENLSNGGIRIFWGLFKKMIVADRLYVLVQTVFGHYEEYNGVIVAAAAIAYTLQLYMEFSGCMDIVIGSGKMFGIMLPENFRQPFLSRNAAEFWRRWHITLGVWFKTYVFYPVSVSGPAKKWSRFGKKHFGKYLAKIGVSAMALFPVWICNGLWHGARWSYIFYGMYYFMILLTEIMLEPVRDKVLKACHVREDACYLKAFQIIKTWVIIFVGELFFRADGLTVGIHMFFSIFRDFELSRLWDGTFLTFGLDQADYLAVYMGCMAVGTVGIMKEKKMLMEGSLQSLCMPVRWTLYYAVILAVVIFGAYGVGYQQVDLIYAGF